LLTPVQRPLIQGLLINRFRGRRQLFDAGRNWLEAQTGVPVLGVMPWLEELFPPEDSLDLLERRGRKSGAELEIAVLRLPSLSNFSDLDPLEAEPSVQLRWIRPGEELGRPDALILPGSKQTLRDLAGLQAAGLNEEIAAYLAGGGQVFGLCGGLQMLGQRLQDPEGLEGLEGATSGASTSTVPGLGLLPLATVFSPAKTLRQRHSTALWPPGDPLQLEGFELHHGRTELLESGEYPSRCSPLAAEAGLGWWRSAGAQGGVVAGTYLHGVFENGPWRRRWLNQLRRRRGLPALSELQPHHGRQRDALLDRLADAFEDHVDLAPLLGTTR
jgi:adenosylcobyric acid synthase